MSYTGVVVKIGQIWCHKDTPDRTFEITEIRENRYSPGLWETLAILRINGANYGATRFGTLNPDLSPYDWSTGWNYDNTNVKDKNYSQINPRTLRKRIREQLAGSLLTEKL